MRSDNMPRDGGAESWASVRKRYVSMMATIDQRFRSGNSVPCERAHITAEEWALFDEYEQESEDLSIREAKEIERLREIEREAAEEIEQLREEADQLEKRLEEDVDYWRRQVLGLREEVAELRNEVTIRIGIDVELQALRAEIERLRSQVAGLLDQHFRDSNELSSLCQQRDDARRSADYWKAEHLAANAEIDRLSKDVAQLRDLLEELETCREGSRVAHAELRTLKAKIEAAEVHIVSEMPGSAFGLIALEPGMVGKRVRLVVCDD